MLDFELHFQDPKTADEENDVVANHQTLPTSFNAATVCHHLHLLGFGKNKEIQGAKRARISGLATRIRQKNQPLILLYHKLFRISLSVACLQ